MGKKFVTDNNINYIINKMNSSFSPIGHNHDNRYALLSHSHDDKYSPISHSHAWDNITGKPSTYTPSSHTHDDRYYTESEIDSKITSLNNTYSPIGHNHDSVYSPLSHSHTWDSITGKPSTYTPSSHTHNSINDAGNGTVTTLAYSKSALSTASWLTAWEGYELRAIAPTTVRSVIGAAASSHTHSYYYINLNATITSSAKTYTNANLKNKDFIDVFVYCSTNDELNRNVRVYDGSETGVTCFKSPSYYCNILLQFNKVTGTLTYNYVDLAGWSTNPINLGTIIYQ